MNRTSTHTYTVHRIFTGQRTIEEVVAALVQAHSG